MESGFQSGFKAGSFASIGIALSGALFGFVFGVLAEHTGLTLYEGLMMSALVYAGALQMICLHLWQHPLPTITLVSIALIVCFRYVLMGFVLQDKFKSLNDLKMYPALFFMADENWALTLIKAKSNDKPLFLYGYLFS